MLSLFYEFERRLCSSLLRRFDGQFHRIGCALMQYVQLPLANSPLTIEFTLELVLDLMPSSMGYPQLCTLDSTFTEDSSYYDFRLLLILGHDPSGEDSEEFLDDADRLLPFFLCADLISFLTRSQFQLCPPPSICTTKQGRQSLTASKAKNHTQFHFLHPSSLPPNNPFALT
jgi:hypothetical protein